MVARRLACLIVASGAILAGCGEATVDKDEIEDTVSSQFSSQGIDLSDVSCPGDVDAKVGAPIACTARNPAGTKLEIEGKVDRVDDDKAHFNVKIVGGTVEGAAVAKEMRAKLEAQVGQKADGASCPDEVKIPTRPPVTCTLEVAGKTYDVKVAVDDKGGLSAEVANQPNR